MRTISTNSMLAAYTVWSFIKFGMFYFLWFVLVVVSLNLINITWGILVVILYFLLFAVVFWYFVFFPISGSQDNLSNEHIEKYGNSAYFVYMFSVANVVGSSLLPYYIPSGLRKIFALLFPVVMLIFLLFVFKDSIRLSRKVDLIKLFVEMTIIVLSMVFQFWIIATDPGSVWKTLSENDSRVITVTLVFVTLFEFILVGVVVTKIGSVLSSFFWRLNIKEAGVTLPWVRISTGNTERTEGFLFDLFDSEYLILKNGECYTAVHWKEINPEKITVCGDDLYGPH